jgi:hypothetical protein
MCSDPCYYWIWQDCWNRRWTNFLKQVGRSKKNENLDDHYFLDRFLDPDLTLDCRHDLDFHLDCCHADTFREHDSGWTTQPDLACRRRWYRSPLAKAIPNARLGFL